MTTAALPRLDVEAIRRDFPILSVPMHGRPLVYLDSAASSQKPRAVLDAERAFYETTNANIHRGVYALSAEATRRYDAARAAVAAYLDAAHSHEVIFTRGTTEGINLVAQSWARPRLRAGDEILITEMEHHSNIVPWQLVAEATGAVLKAAPVTDAGELDLDAFERLLTGRTRVVAVGHVSNALGTINPVRRIADLAHGAGAVLVVDGAQAAPHLPLSVRELDADFYACSSHKMLGPTGVGALYGREELLDSMPPYQGGGDMISTVTIAKSTWAPLPAKFEAGTPNIAGAVGLGAAVEYIEKIGRDRIAEHEHQLLALATDRVTAVPGLRIIGTAPLKASVLSFVMEGVHPHDIGTVLDSEGVCIRAGHHCAQPLMKRLDVPATARASFALYNQESDVDALVGALQQTRRLFG
ncbi:MAG TPA: cysteine desulfurase [Gemmatimonadales bacterium]|nr:cysteine desulfurase [Gemmatimonadales bacterium]